MDPFILFIAAIFFGPGYLVWLLVTYLLGISRDYEGVFFYSFCIGWPFALFGIGFLICCILGVIKPDDILYFSTKPEVFFSILSGGLICFLVFLGGLLIVCSLKMVFDRSFKTGESIWLCIIVFLILWAISRFVVTALIDRDAADPVYAFFFKRLAYIQGGLIIVRLIRAVIECMIRPAHPNDHNTGTSDTKLNSFSFSDDSFAFGTKQTDSEDDVFLDLDS